ncbi:DUF3558 domain-containing protein [Tsukamurella strandjordii]|uniref:DUF3558 domain-containing protein n=1 Tax=Tsukamurella TaxID=2060 RepID=UPI001C7D3C70|nr:DUF3558 domain-containing protein [Tsukamurella sp. TY48]GIZ99589.1 hypothetical protein TTY48_42010 [Tsukamurella sp. TY48]
MRVIPFALAAALLASGCAVSIPGEPVATGKARASTKPLPFTPTIKNRTNDRTDGTSFEPCTAYTDAELIAIDINPSSIRDAAQVDAANYRGCRWNANDYTDSRGGGQYSQIVGREMGLDEYKRYMNTLKWQPDRQAHGRTIAYAPEKNYCISAFASEQSIVTTIAGSTNPSPGNKAECDRAIAFASLAVSKAP